MFAGLVPLRYLINRPSRIRWEYPALAVCAVVVIAVNFGAAHYRELAATTEAFDETRVIARMFTEPFNLSLVSYALFFLGLLFAIFATYKGYTASDKYPGYEAQQRQELVLKNGSVFVADLPFNPCVEKPTPIILVPTDLLRALPVATDWDEVGDIAARNEVYRRAANEQLGDIWKRKSLEAKEELKTWATASKGNFEVLLDLIRGAKPKSYDVANDPLGELVWKRLAHELVGRIRTDVELPKRLDLRGVKQIVSTIIDEFKFLVEDRRLSEELYAEDRHPRPERAAQRLFFAVAYAFCKAHNLDLTPEADIVSKRRDAPYRSGEAGWIKVKTAAWRQANKDRDLFDNRR